MQHQSTLEVQELVAESLKSAIPYSEYRLLVNEHAQSFTSTGHTQTEALSRYTRLNDRRMRRWDKTLKLDGIDLASIKKINHTINWIVLTESWCGDAAHTIPVMNKLAELNPHINLQIVLRDDHPHLMDAFLTNGNMSIPKLIVQDTSTGEILNSWGPRPDSAAEMVVEAKNTHGTLPPSFKEELQIWYNNDKGKSTARELARLID